jgi:hypothetical protein
MATRAVRLTAASHCVAELSHWHVGDARTNHQDFCRCIAFPERPTAIPHGILHPIEPAKHSLVQRRCVGFFSSMAQELKIIWHIRASLTPASVPARTGGLAPP